MLVSSDLFFSADGEKLIPLLSYILSLLLRSVVGVIYTRIYAYFATYENTRVAKQFSPLRRPVYLCLRSVFKGA